MMPMHLQHQCEPKSGLDDLQPRQQLPVTMATTKNRKVLKKIERLMLSGQIHFLSST